MDSVGEFRKNRDGIVEVIYTGKFFQEVNVNSPTASLTFDREDGDIVDPLTG